MSVRGWPVGSWRCSGFVAALVLAGCPDRDVREPDAPVTLPAGSTAEELRRRHSASAVYELSSGGESFRVLVFEPGRDNVDLVFYRRDDESAGWLMHGARQGLAGYHTPRPLQAAERAGVLVDSRRFGVTFLVRPTADGVQLESGNPEEWNLGERVRIR